MATSPAPIGAAALRTDWCLDAYDDEAEGCQDRHADGGMAMTCVTLRPRVRFSGREPGDADPQAPHREVHDACSIANSVRTELRCEPRMAATPGPA